MEREGKKDRIKTHLSMREMIVSKVVKKWLYKYHFSYLNYFIYNSIILDEHLSTFYRSITL